MLDFVNIQLSDKLWIDELLNYCQFQGTEYCFTSIFIWKKFYHTTICRYKDLLVIRSEAEGRVDYLYPVGKGSAEDFKEVLILIQKESQISGKESYLGGLTKDLLASVDFLSSIYKPVINRDTFDYIYLTEDLANLSGKKYQAKRNHIKHFEALDDWHYEEVSDSNLKECIKMNELWCKENHCLFNLSKQSESCATRCALANFEALQLKGGLLRVDGEVVAFSLGEQLNNNTFIVHVEKAFARVDGAYPMINREFIRHEAGNLKYVNREDDAADEGLRKAKLSYHPAYLLEKSILRIN